MPGCRSLAPYPMNANDHNPTPSEPSSSPLVFVVDDSEALGEMIKIFLTDAGYDVQVFSNPLQALAAMQTSETLPSLLISDYRMPGINGLELIHRCKLIHPSLKVIAASANILDEDIEKYPFHPDRILPKPYTTTSLLATVQTLLAP